MPTRNDIVLLAAYNASMNAKLYAAAAKVPKEVLSADRGAFFGSILGTLNHLVAGDIIWLRRFMAHPAHLASLQAMVEFPRPTGLAHMVSDDLGLLLEYRLRLDAIIDALAAEVTDKDLGLSIPYRHSNGEVRKNFGSLLLHLFNHQTHHRGQASTLLSQLQVDVGVTDLLELIPDQD